NSWADSASLQPSTAAVGNSRATSAARFGPDNTAIKLCGKICARISDIRKSLPCSIPLVQLRKTGLLVRQGCSAPATDRNAVDGVTNTIKSAPAQPARLLVRQTASGNEAPGKYS